MLHFQYLKNIFFPKDGKQPQLMQNKEAGRYDVTNFIFEH
jgi:hypothetical protein